MNLSLVSSSGLGTPLFRKLLLPNGSVINMDIDPTPLCPLPNIGPCVGERCNFWDPEEGCLGTGVAFASDPSLDQIISVDADSSD